MEEKHKRAIKHDAINKQQQQQQETCKAKATMGPLEQEQLETPQTTDSANNKEECVAAERPDTPNSEVNETPVQVSLIFAKENFSYLKKIDW